MYYYVLYVFLHLSLFFCYNMNLYFGPAAIHYILNNILSYLIDKGKIIGTVFLYFQKAFNLVDHMKY